MKTMILSLLLLYSMAGIAQYDWQTDVRPVSKDGFYRIDLSPELVSTLHRGQDDLRLVDETGAEIPYLLKQESPSKKRIYHPYPIIEKEHGPFGTVIILENKDRHVADNISLLVRNFDARKRLVLTGSNDRDQWYAVKDDYVFYEADETDRCSEIKVLNFPMVDYRYFRIVIYDYFTDPINIIKAGYYTMAIDDPDFVPIAGVQLSRDSVSGNNSHILIRFKGRPFADRIQLTIGAPGIYHREVRLCRVRRNKRGVAYYPVVSSTILQSNKPALIDCPAWDETEMMLIIKNDDNPPLKVSGIQAYQRAYYLDAWLKAGDPYYIRSGCSNATEPHYDIYYFTDSMAVDIPRARIAATQAVVQERKADEGPGKYILWFILGAAILLMGYLSHSMISGLKLNEGD